MFLCGPQQTRGSSWTWETPGRVKALSYFPLSHTWCTESRHGTKTPPKNFFCRLIKLKSSSELLFFCDVTVRFYFRFGPAPLASVKSANSPQFTASAVPRRTNTANRFIVTPNQTLCSVKISDLSAFRSETSSPRPSWSDRLYFLTVCSLLHSRPLVNHRRLQVTPTCWPR